MRFGFKQPLVGEKRCVTTLITAAEKTTGGSTVYRNMQV